MSKKWQYLGAIKRKRLALSIISSSSSPYQVDMNSCSTSSSTAEKGHFVVYTSDSRRFVLPLAHLNSGIFTELLRLAEEELPSNGPLTLPFDLAFLEYVNSMIR
ncbi:Small auxin-up RNA [Parasponia andersonii]|uniref:Small auxin-up RNA n=1 Tax=Parasponia andersonii TaxID=3476 RepID=A0A2P5AIM7_PARAD|nr:Small auxin-up RNA [Parasponia andersonii]